jgi:hypothetical protein
MVRILHSLSSDDSTVCTLIEKDAGEEQFTTQRSLSHISISTMVEIRDIEGNITRPKKKEEPPQVLHPYVHSFGRISLFVNVLRSRTLTRLNSLHVN